MSLGSELLAAREAAGLSLEDVAERTRIRRTVIDRIEHDDFSLCGGDVYARGHIRTLAKVSGIDPQPLVDEYDRLHQPEAPSASEVFEAETHVARERGGPNWTAAMAAALVLIVAVAAFQLLRGGGGAGSAHGATTSSPPAVSPTSTPPSPSTVTSTPTPSQQPTLVAKAGVTVRLLVATGKSWVSATSGTQTLYEGLLAAGDSRLFTAPHPIKLVIGNAGAVRLVVNDVNIGSPGGAGQVVRLTFGPGAPSAQG
jgi:cytoskeletal protein RodZ